MATTPIIHTDYIETPIGQMLLGATEGGICLLEFINRRMLETQLQRISKLFKTEVRSGASPLHEAATQQLAEYFSGHRRRFELQLLLNGTPFQRQSWEALLQIPYGETRSYKSQAEAIGRPTAVRAVARANGDNRISIIVPCHRVIGNDGALTGYGGGLWRKKFLLELEAR